MSRKERIETKLSEALSPVHLDVVDESHRHSAGAGAESHYNVTLISDDFNQTLRVKRHRRVHELLAAEFEGGLHALTLTLLTPDEWSVRQGAIASPKCRGGSKAAEPAPSRRERIVWTFGVITDIHFGPEASYGGKLRKLTGAAPALVDAFAQRMREQVKPDLVFNLGDCIEDASPAEDLALYEDCLAHLARWGGRLEHIAGNHDRIHLSPAELRRAWGMTPEGPLYRSFDLGALHVVVLYTHERKDQDITIDDEQLAWLDADLARHRDHDVLVVMHHSAAEQDVGRNRWFSTCPHLCLVANRQALRTRLAAHGRVRLVLNGHLHWNHLDVVGGIPYVTLQSLIENVDDDAPGRAAAAHAVVRITEQRVLVEVEGAETCRYQFDR